MAQQGELSQVMAANTQEKKTSRFCGQGTKAFWSNKRQARSSYWAIYTDAWKKKKPHCFNFDFRC